VAAAGRYAKGFHRIEEAGVPVADRREAEEIESANDTPRRKPRWWRRTWFKVVVVVVIVCVGAVVFAAEYAIRHAEPILRARVVETLSAHFHAPVELDHLDLSLIKAVELVATGVEVEGRGLRIPYVGDTSQLQTDHNAPMVYVRHFAFRTRVRALMHQPTRIAEVDVEGMELHIPPGEMRKQILGPKDKQHQPKISLIVGQIRCKDVKLIIDTTKPGKDPMEFDIRRLDLQDVGAAQPFTYQADLINPKPIGEVRAAGHIGPWNADNPRETALDGSYSFSNADLNTIKGISGILSSHGEFGGVLDHITIDGETQTPDFALDVSDHPMPLHTVFHAYVDGTSGDTYLQPVKARLKDSDFTAQGKVVLIRGKGHDIDLQVDVPHAHIQDFLELGVKTRPPLMDGFIAMKAHLHIPPGDTRVPQKLELSGAFELHDVHFNNPQFQDKVDGLSARAQGNPKEVASDSTDRQAQVSSLMSAKFSLGHGLMSVNDLHYQIPGALVLMNGVYSINGNLFEFKGHVRTDATASHMLTGWKSWLLKPVDPFLKKNGAGLELPISISGTQGDVHFGLALHGTADESNQKMAEDLKTNRESMLAAAKAKRERDEAAKEQAKADGSVGGKKTKAEKKAEKEREKAERHAAESQSQQAPAQGDQPPPQTSGDPQLHRRPAAPPQ
jgi:hypothetical protein